MDLTNTEDAEHMMGLLAADELDRELGLAVPAPVWLGLRGAQMTAVGSPVAWLGRATALRLARRAAARSSASIASTGDSRSADIGVRPRHRARVRIGAVEASDGDVQLLREFGRSTPSCAWGGSPIRTRSFPLCSPGIGTFNRCG